MDLIVRMKYLRLLTMGKGECQGLEKNACPEGSAHLGRGYRRMKLGFWPNLLNYRLKKAGPILTFMESSYDLGPFVMLGFFSSFLDSSLFEIQNLPSPPFFMPFSLELFLIEHFDIHVLLLL
uniref:Uncharacterized protein n=1 Tax=Opuntia streptacantha TaxID=393608 RepID=A0A7C8YTQ3_OPUST